MTIETESSEKPQEIKRCGLGPQASGFGGPQTLGPGPGLGLGRPGLGARAHRGLGPEPPKAGRPDPKRSAQSPGRGLAKGWDQLNNYDETRSDHGPVGNAWLCYILVTIDYATYL